jgi:nucleoside-diphosphate-sugar epimerase
VSAVASTDRRPLLVTGAWGNVGRALVRELVARGRRVRAFDRDSPRARRRAAELAGRVELWWGDVRRAEEVAQATAGCAAAFHLAFVLPNASERDPALSRAVNVDGSRHLIAALAAERPSARLVFASTYAVYGETRGDEALLTAATPPRPTNHYTRHKLEVEQLIRDSGLTACILRLGVVLSAEAILEARFDPLVFDLPVDAKQELLHAEDAARAMANCLDRDAVWGRTLLVGGGPGCQVRYAELINRSLEAMGIGALPARAFSPDTRQGGGWMDTRHSQALLDYQRWSFEDHLRALAARAGWRRRAARLVAPLVRWALVRRSPHRGSAPKGTAQTAAATKKVGPRWS